MAIQNTTKNNSYEEFNFVQQAFYTNPHNFRNLTDYEIKKHGFVLINNLVKGFPNLAESLFRLNCLNFTGVSSPSILRALHNKFISNSVNNRMPQFIFFKGKSVRKEKVPKTKVTVKGIDFSDDIIFEIKSIMMIDSKDYETIKYSEDVQKLGNQLLGEIIRKDQELLNKKSKRKLK